MSPPIDPVARAVAAAAATALDAMPARVRVVDISSRFPWAVKHRVFLASDPESEGAVAVVVDRTSGVALVSGDGAPDHPLDGLAAMLAGAGITLPHGLPPTALAEAIRYVGASPDGFIGSSAFLAKQLASRRGGPPPIEQWCAGDAENRALFERHAADPVLVQDGARFELRFSVFTSRGAVESWVARGDAARVDAAERSIVAPPRTLRPPFG